MVALIAVLILLAVLLGGFAIAKAVTWLLFLAVVLLLASVAFGNHRRRP